VHLTNDDLTVEAFHPDQLSYFENDSIPAPIHRFRWSITNNQWYMYDSLSGEWNNY